MIHSSDHRLQTATDGGVSHTGGSGESYLGFFLLYYSSGKNTFIIYFCVCMYHQRKGLGILD